MTTSIPEIDPAVGNTAATLGLSAVVAVGGTQTVVVSAAALAAMAIQLATLFAALRCSRSAG